MIAYDTESNNYFALMTQKVTTIRNFKILQNQNLKSKVEHIRFHKVKVLRFETSKMCQHSDFVKQVDCQFYF